MRMEAKIGQKLEERRSLDRRAARAAGWARSDVLWERLMEDGNTSYLAGEIARARSLFRRADLLSRFAFRKTDLRRATAAANLALLAMRDGRHERARRHQRRAIKIWKHAPEEIAALYIGPRARSSLYHLRMEVRHRETFHNNLRARFSRFAGETEEALHCLTDPLPLPHRFHARWLGERPGFHDDTRKFLAACLLIIDHPVP